MSARGEPWEGASGLDLYAVLGVDGDARPEDIRKAYRDMVRLVHPDKLPNARGDQHAVVSAGKFLDVQRAWQVLSDPGQKNRYDAWRAKQRVVLLMSEEGLGNHVHEELLLSELEYDEEEYAHVYLCRCGETVYIDEDDFENRSDAVVTCGSCSLRYSVTRNVQDGQTDLRDRKKQEESEESLKNCSADKKLPNRHTESGDSQDRPTICDIIYSVAGRHPTLPAVQYLSESANDQTEHAPAVPRVVQYAELCDAADNLAYEIICALAPSLGPVASWEKRPLIGTMISENFDAVCILVAILRIGAVLVPMDSGAPQGRTTAMAKIAELDLVIAHQTNLDSGSLASVVQKEGVNVVALEHLYRDNSGALVASRKLRSSSRSEVLKSCRSAIDDRSLCHVAFTSGTTGEPKGVAVEHRSMVAYMKAKTLDQKITAESTILVASSFVFDPFIGDVFVALGAGATVALSPRAQILTNLGGCIRGHGATHVCCTPQHWETLGTQCNSKTFPSLRVVSLGGEKMRPGLMKQWLEDASAGFQLINTYGVTEATVYQSTRRCDPATPPNDIGSPLTGIELILRKCEEVDSCAAIDGSWSEVPRQDLETLGEICIAGAQVARGYLKLPDLTREKFITFRGKRAYRTGDLARWNTRGTLSIVGRVDRQVKIRGRRFELAEVEEVLVGADIVDSVFADIIEINAASKVLVVGIVSASESVSVPQGDAENASPLCSRTGGSMRSRHLQKRSCRLLRYQRIGSILIKFYFGELVRGN